MINQPDKTGYIKLYRTVINDDVFQNSKAWHLFTFCLFAAQFSTRNRRGQTVGTLKTTQKELQSALGWRSNHTIKTALEFLKNRNYIDYKFIPGTGGGFEIRVLNFEKAKKVNSNSQLYQQAGNAVTVNVIKNIAECLKIEKEIKNEK